MSEYQFYEFKSIDKSLSKEDRIQIASWSSRANPSNTGAIFTYSYGNFPKDEISVIEKFFDAMFYISNWGTTRLIFKFPKELFEFKQIKQYCIEDGLRIIEKSNCFLIDMEFVDEEDGRWIEGEGWLTSLISLREDIMNGDYRSLYLIWLKNSIIAIDSEYGNILPDHLEPQVPKQLNGLNGALQDLVEIFDIDKDYISAATENSHPEIKEDTIDLKTSIDKLPENEKLEFLERLLNGEALLSMKLKNRLKEFLRIDDPIAQEINRRSIGELVRRVEILKQERKNKEQIKRQELLLRKIKNLELHESEHWTKVHQLILDKNSKAYDEAIYVLEELKELSIYKGRFKEYCDKIEIIRKKNSRLSGLTGRIFRANLSEK
jgi:hypothetical protein